MQKLDLNGKHILVTGGAGFIGSNLIKRLFKDLKDNSSQSPVVSESNHCRGTIVNIDNMNAYYDVSLKEYRLQELEKVASSFSPQPSALAPQPSSSAFSPQPSYIFVKGDIADKNFIDEIFGKYHFDIVVNLAAQAGVRYSIDNPDAYIQSPSTTLRVNNYDYSIYSSVC